MKKKSKLKITGPINRDFLMDQIEKIKDSPIKINTNIEYTQLRILPLYSQIEKHRINTKNPALRQLEKEINNQRLGHPFLILKSMMEINPKTIDLIIKFHDAHLDQLNTQIDIISKTLPEIHKELKILSESTPFYSTELNGQLLQKEYPNYSEETLKNAIAVITTMYFAKTSTIVGLKQTDEKLKLEINENKKDQKQLISDFAPILTQISGSAGKIIKFSSEAKFDQKQSEKFKRKLKTKMRKDGLYDSEINDMFNYDNDGSNPIHVMIEDPSNLGRIVIRPKNAISNFIDDTKVKLIKPIKLSKSQEYEIKANYLLIWLFTTEIFVPSEITISLSYAEYEIEKLKSDIFLLSYKMVSKLNDCVYKTTTPNPISNRIIPLKNNSKIISAYDLKSIKDENERKIAFGLTDLLFSDINNNLNISTVPALTKYKIPFELIDSIPDYYPNTISDPIQTLSDELAKTTDKNLIYQSLKAAQARILIGNYALHQNHIDQLSEIPKSINKKEEELSKLKNDKNIKSLNSQLNDKNIIISKLTNENHNYQVKIEDLNQKYELLNKNLAPYDRLKASYETLESKKNTILNENKELKKQIDQILSSINQESKPSNDFDIIEFKKVLNSYKPIIVGGHPTWASNLRKEIPDSKLFHGEKTGLDVSSIKNTKLLIINTAMLNHGFYYKVTNQIKTTDNMSIVFINTASTNIPLTLKKIHDQMKDQNIIG